jgi:hypothetical protein
MSSQKYGQEGQDKLRELLKYLLLALGTGLSYRPFIWLGAGVGNGGLVECDVVDVSNLR